MLDEKNNDIHEGNNGELQGIQPEADAPTHENTPEPLETPDHIVAEDTTETPEATVEVHEEVQSKTEDLTHEEGSSETATSEPLETPDHIVAEDTTETPEATIKAHEEVQPKTEGLTHEEDSPETATSEPLETPDHIVAEDTTETPEATVETHEGAPPKTEDLTHEEDSSETATSEPLETPDHIVAEDTTETPEATVKAHEEVQPKTEGLTHEEGSSETATSEPLETPDHIVAEDTTETPEATVETHEEAPPKTEDLTHEEDSSEAATSEPLETPDHIVAEDTTEIPEATVKAHEEVQPKTERLIHEEDSPETAISEPLETPDHIVAEDTTETPEATVENPDEAQAETATSDTKDEGYKQYRSIPMPDYHTMDMEKLVSELEKLVENEKVQAIKKHVEAIKHEFDRKHRTFLDAKKEEFTTSGGNAIDFKYTSPVKLTFDSSYTKYKEKRNRYYKELEQTLQLNLEKRLEIIESLKALIDVEQDINTTYKTFKQLQDSWRKAGAIPRGSSSDIWKTYRHHVERFYDFLELNRELRDIDFKKNLEEKEKIIVKAEQLLEEEDIPKAFRALQVLHKIWKEDIGPVDREHREEIWKRFSDITKIIHQKRQEYLKNINEIYKQNLSEKQQIIQKMEQFIARLERSDDEWRKQIKEIEQLREAFISVGKVPHNVSKEVWASFKEVCRNFNRSKNALYKKLKKESLENLKKKRELLEIAESLKDSEDWEKTTPIMKDIQSKWKVIGHVPRKYSNDIWARFKEACNHYFNRLHTQQNQEEKQQSEGLHKKKELLDTLIDFKFSDDPEQDFKTIKESIAQWRTLSNTTYRKRSIEDKFNKTIAALFEKLHIDKEQIELIKYGNKLEHLTHDNALLRHEHSFVRRRISELTAEIRQLENNLQFFANATKENPLVKDVVLKIDKHKEDLSVWEAKLKKLETLAQKS